MQFHVVVSIFVCVHHHKVVFVDLHSSSDEEVRGLIVCGWFSVEAYVSLCSNLDHATTLQELATDYAWQ